MYRSMTSNRAGLEFYDPGFENPGRSLLGLLFRLRPSDREKLLFGISPTCLPLQKVLRWCLGGSFVIESHFTDGPLANYAFECWSSEKYFMLGSKFENEVQALLSEMVSPGDVGYDVGSHIGYMAMLFSSLVGARGKVFSFEPSPYNFARLARNIELNPQAKRHVKVTRAAVSDCEGVGWLHEDSSQSMIQAGGAAEGASRVETVRLDDFVFRDGHAAPDFLKIDVEGHAGPCLRGMTRILKTFRPAMIMEIHHESEAEEVRVHLEAGGYTFRTIDTEDQFPRRIVAEPRS